MSSKSKYTVKAIKSFMGMDCPGFNATLCMDGKKIAEVINDGSGGETRFNWEDRKALKVTIPWVDWKGNPTMACCTPEEAGLMEHIRGMRWEDLSGSQDLTGQINPGVFVENLINDFKEQSRFRRFCRTSTLFRIKGDKPDEWRTIEQAFTPQIKALIVGKYGNQVESIMNENVHAATL
ncbi:MAG: hypothetical protein WCL16_04230 [bacterium]